MLLNDAYRILDFWINRSKLQGPDYHLSCRWADMGYGVTFRKDRSPRYWFDSTEYNSPRERPDLFPPEFLDAVDTFAAYKLGPEYYAAK